MRIPSRRLASSPGPMDRSPAQARSRALLLVLALAALAWWIWFRVASGIVLEDALITFRYSDMLAAGHGLVFSEGEYVLAATNALYSCALALPSWLLGPESLFVAAPMLGIACALAAGFFLVGALRAARVPWSACLLVAALTWFHPDVVWTTVGGMETGMVLLWMCLSLWAIAHERALLAGLAAAALVMTRPDGLVWAVLVLLALIALRVPRALRGVGVCALLVGAWWLLLARVYGHVLPHSVLAKQEIGQELPSDGWLANLAAHARWILDGTALGSGGGAWSLVAWLGLALGLYGGARLLRERARRPLALLFVFPFALAAAYWVGEAPREFDWYLVPAAFAWSACVALGLAPDEARSSSKLARGLRWSLSLVLALALVRGNLHALDRWTAYQRAEDGLRKPVGEWLAANTPERASVAMEAIGYQGYYSRRRVIDLAGLVSPAVVRAHREHDSNAAAFAAVLAEQRPDYLVLRSFEVDENRSFHGGPLFADAQARALFDARYRELRRFELAHPNRWGALGRITVYERVGGAR